MRTIIYALANLVKTAILNFKMATTKYGYSPYLSIRGFQILDFPFIYTHLFYEKSNPIRTPIIAQGYLNSGSHLEIKHGRQ